MAIDETLLNWHSEGKIPPVIRFYGWDKPSLSKVGKEALKSQSANLKTVTKDKLDHLKNVGMEKSNQAFQNLKSSTSNLLQKNHDEEDYVNEDEEQDESNEDSEETEMGEHKGDYQKIKEENDVLQDRLHHLEEKLDKILEINDDSDDESKATGEDPEDDSEADTDKEAKSKKDGSKKNANKKNNNGEQSSKKSDSEKSRKKKTQKKGKADEDEEDTGLSSDDDTSASA
ncbi:hypothetical protein WMZ97_21425 [Lentibacillus sp. N15]|uniref:hypothetical protein n=1 Tax=Lentibacillus songyuanensis TaxID=3136161 RepID=UPI0031BAF168